MINLENVLCKVSNFHSFHIFSCNFLRFSEMILQVYLRFLELLKYLIVNDFILEVRMRNFKEFILVGFELHLLID